MNWYQGLPRPMPGIACREDVDVAEWSDHVTDEENAAAKLEER